MSKFRIKMKLQGFELEVEGTREDVPAITRNLGQQLSSLMQPSGAILEGRVLHTAQQSAQLSSPTVNAEVPRKRRGRKNAALAANGNGEGVEEPIDWRHQTEKFGLPKQAWKTSDKAIWLIHVVSTETDVKELSGRRITDTFNKHFRQAGAVTTSNVNRDLGVLKVRKTPSPIAEDTTQAPPRWYLTEEGQRRANELVADALGRH
jgi:hypothetical protein